VLTIGASMLVAGVFGGQKQVNTN
ncbi:hypothetical protein, partial [Staphylococcus aureus]